MNDSLSAEEVATITALTALVGAFLVKLMRRAWPEATKGLGVGLNQLATIAVFEMFVMALGLVEFSTTGFMDSVMIPMVGAGAASSIVGIAKKQARPNGNGKPKPDEVDPGDQGADK